MTLFHAGVMEVGHKDTRYAFETYEFLFPALHHAQKIMGRETTEAAPSETPAPVDKRHHISGRELLQGVRDLALREFGLMASTVFRQWGIQRTDDFGDMVFNLVEAGLMSKTAEDNQADFHDVYDLDQA